MQVYRMKTKDGEELIFRAPDAGGYVTIEGGGLRGDTLLCGKDDLAHIARRWHRQRTKKEGGLV